MNGWGGLLSSSDISVPPSDNIEEIILKKRLKIIHLIFKISKYTLNYKT